MRRYTEYLIRHKKFVELFGHNQILYSVVLLVFALIEVIFGFHLSGYTQTIWLVLPVILLCAHIISLKKILDDIFPPKKVEYLSYIGFSQAERNRLNCFVLLPANLIALVFVFITLAGLPLILRVLSAIIFFITSEAFAFVAGHQFFKNRVSTKPAKKTKPQKTHTFPCRPIAYLIKDFKENLKPSWVINLIVLYTVAVLVFFLFEIAHANPIGFYVALYLIIVPFSVELFEAEPDNSNSFYRRYYKISVQQMVA